MNVNKNQQTANCSKNNSTTKTSEIKVKKINKHEIPKSVIEECLSTIG
jgi:hypothetical protein